MAPKKTLSKTTSKVVREIKRDSKQITKTVKATKRAVKTIVKLFAPKQSKQKRTGSKAHKTKQTPIVQPKPTASNKTSSKSSTGTKSKAKAPKKVLPKSGRSSYTLQELASSKSRNLGTLFSNIEKNRNKIDALKRPEQFFTASIYNKQTHTPFYSIEGLISYLGASGGIDQANAEDALLFTKISILTEGAPGAAPDDNTRAFHQKITELKEANRMENENNLAEAAQILGLPTKKTRNKNEVVKGLVSKFKERERESESIIDGLLARILELEGKPKPKKKAKKAAPKKAVKKASPKKAVKKAAPKKAVKKASSKPKSTKETKRNANRKHTIAGRPSSSTKAKSKAATSSRTKSSAKSSQKKTANRKRR